MSHVSGQDHHSAKLDKQAVWLIRNSDCSLRYWAEHFGVSHVAIWKVRRGITWRAA